MKVIKILPINILIDKTKFNIKPFYIIEHISMKSTNYGYHKTINIPFENAVKKTKEALQTQGFGILSELDIKETLKKKLDVDHISYVILGACNPPSAYKALQNEIEIGLMLPCNVIIYKQGQETTVSAILPTITMGMVDNKKVKEVAIYIETKLKTAIDSL